MVPDTSSFKQPAKINEGEYLLYSIFRETVVLVLSSNTLRIHKKQLNRSFSRRVELLFVRLEITNELHRSRDLE